MEQTGQPKNNANTALIAIALIVIVIGGVFGYQSLNKKDAAMESQVTPTTVQEAPISPQAQESMSAYKDGVYTVVGNYSAPGGTEEIGVTVTLANGVISEVEVEPKATRPISKTRQEDFVAHYKELVVGKNIDEISLSKVSGSSLTPKGFNDAIEKIKTEAKS